MDGQSSNRRRGNRTRSIPQKRSHVNSAVPARQPRKHIKNKRYPKTSRPPEKKPGERTEIAQLADHP